jgi:carbamoyltransferase
MVFGFDTTKKGQEKLPAAIHPYDSTARPQMLTQEKNPSYYDLIEKVAFHTGVKGVLNTSYNLHGEPIVRTPEDAISAFVRCDLDYLLLGGHILEKIR